MGGTKGCQIKNLIDLQKNEIQATHDAYILEQMAVQLKGDAEEELMSQFDLVISDIEVVVDAEDQRPFPENLQKVVLTLNEEITETEAVEVVKSVEINTNDPFEENEPNPIQNDKVIQLLSDKWSIDERTIELQIEGGDKEQS